MDFTNAPTTAGELFQWAVMLTLLGFVLQGPLNRAREALLGGMAGTKRATQAMRERKVRDEDEEGMYLHYYVSSLALFVAILAAVSVMLAVGRTLGLISPTFGQSRENMDSVIVIIVAVALVFGGAYGFYRFRWLGDERNRRQEGESRILESGLDERHLALATVAIAAVATLVGAGVRAVALLTDPNATLSIGGGPVADTLDVLARVGVVVFWVMAELSFVATGILAHPGLEFSAAQTLRIFGWLIYLLVAGILGLLALVISVFVYIPNRIGDGIRAVWRLLTRTKEPAAPPLNAADDSRVRVEDPDPYAELAAPASAPAAPRLRPRPENLRGAERIGEGQDEPVIDAPVEAAPSAEDPGGRRANPPDPLP